MTHRTQGRLSGLWASEVRAVELSGPVTVSQGAARPVKTLEKATTCVNCKRPMEAGTTFRIRCRGGLVVTRGIGHVTCPA